MNLLYLSAFVPFPASDGDRIRALFTLRGLSRHHRLYGFFLDQDCRGPVPPALRRYFACIERIPLPKHKLALQAALSIFRNGPAHSYAFWSGAAHSRLLRALSRWPIEAAHVHRLRMMPYAERLGLPYCLDATDCLTFYFRERRHLPAWRRFYAALDGRALAEHERRWANAAKVVLVTTPKEKARMRRLGVNSRLAVVPNGIDLKYWRPARREPPYRNLVFLGNLAYPPNSAGLKWFLREAAPIIARRNPGIGLEIIGQGASLSLARLARSCAMPVALRGYQDDLRPALTNSLAMLCVLPAAVGIQNKVLQAMACETPVIASANVARSLGARQARDLVVANQAEDIAGAVSRLSRDSWLRMRIGRAGRRMVSRRFSFDLALRVLAAATDSLRVRTEG